MSGKNRMGMGTMAVHGPSNRKSYSGELVTPVFQSAVFRMTEDGLEAMAKGSMRETYMYTRHGNPSNRSVEEKIAALEGAEDSLVTSSGMAAIASTLLAFLSEGDHLLTTRDLYGGTSSFISQELERLGIEVSFVDVSQTTEIQGAISPNTKVIYLEPMSNPLLKLADVSRIAELAKQFNVVTVFDNTFLSPVNLKPVSLGADLVIHSCSKYLNGHTDIIAGAVSGRRDHIDRVWKRMINFGGCLDPHSSFLLERGLKTLVLRMTRHSENALAIARHLEKHPKIERVDCTLPTGQRTT